MNLNLRTVFGVPTDGTFLGVYNKSYLSNVVILFIEVKNKEI